MKHEYAKTKLVRLVGDINGPIIIACINEEKFQINRMTDWLIIIYHNRKNYIYTRGEIIPLDYFSIEPIPMEYYLLLDKMLIRDKVIANKKKGTIYYYNPQ